jgi:hypothetical protein
MVCGTAFVPLGSAEHRRHFRFAAILPPLATVDHATAMQQGWLWACKSAIVEERRRARVSGAGPGQDV